MKRLFEAITSIALIVLCGWLLGCFEQNGPDIFTPQSFIDELNAETEARPAGPRQTELTPAEDRELLNGWVVRSGVIYDPMG